MPYFDRDFSPHGRRRFLQILGAGATLAIPGWVVGENSIWVPEDLPVTPTQTQGPFYPETTIEQQVFNDTDLRRKLDNHELSKGKLIEVNGVVRNQKGRPLTDATIEIWQACSTGRYNHSQDAKSQRLLDNNFQFWGRAITGENGQYSFKTIIPGKYPGRTGRHIHYRIDAPGHQRLSTQCYFSEFGDDNRKDGIYRSLSVPEQKLVTVELDRPEIGDSEKSRQGKFDIVLATA